VSDWHASIEDQEDIDSREEWWWKLDLKADAQEKRDRFSTHPPAPVLELEDAA
jgi:hypothetical protein